ncbi:MAG: DUF4367 domain-containing protein [Ruminococcaceae bacterium]|nr:DUF4367 domain-containing protein [Oscillospiraceae bacterium]
MISDKELREAARRYEKARLRTLPEPEDCGAVFSPGFERQMKKLIFRTDHPVRYWLHRLLWLLLALLVVGAAAAMLLSKQAEEPPVLPETAAPAVTAELPSSPSAEPSSPLAGSQEPEPAAKAIVYRPTWLPEGCEWARETLYENEGMIVYRTTDGTEAVFLYDLTGAEMGAEGREVPVGDGAGVLLLGQGKEGLNELFWRDETAGVSFWLSAPFEEEDMIRVAESVKAEE